MGWWIEVQRREHSLSLHRRHVTPVNSNVCYDALTSTAGQALPVDLRLMVTAWEYLVSADRRAYALEDELGPTAW